MRGSVQAGLAVAGCLLAASCEGGRLRGRTSDAEDLGVYTTVTLDDPREEALAVLAREARRREARFLDAASPGSEFAWARPDQAEIDAHLFSDRELYAIGAQLFHHAFTEAEGLGGADAPFPMRFQVGARGGPAAVSCADCHWRGGIAGAGDASDNAYLQGDGITQEAGLARNPPSLAGAGWVELVAREMSDELGALRLDLQREARRKRATVRGSLVTKGVSFGTLTARPDGSLDLSGLEGIASDLVVRPFGRKGTESALRTMIEAELAMHHGMQATSLVGDARSQPSLLGPFGGDDPDGDGVIDEINEGQISVLTLFVALQAAPVVELPDTTLVPVSLWATGRERFVEIGCASCHTPALEILSSDYTLEGRSNRRLLSVDLEADGAAPRLQRDALSGDLMVPLLSDLKRHDMGASLAEARADRGVPASWFVTPPLWGLSRSGPYLHDGRAPTLHDAIVAHDGEARAARDAYEALGEQGQAPIRVFLVSQTRAPTFVVR